MRATDVRRGERIVDVGAGTGELTLALARAGAHVTAIELDHELASALRRRTSGFDAVRIVEADFLRWTGRGRPDRIVANLPFGGASAILRAALAGSTDRVDVIVDRGLARGLTSDRARPESAMWAPWWKLRITASISRNSFRPPPSVEAGLLTVGRRDPPLVPAGRHSDYARFVTAAFAGPTLRRALRPWLTERQFTAAARELGLARDATASDASPLTIARLYVSACGPFVSGRRTGPSPRTRAR